MTPRLAFVIATLAALLVTAAYLAFGSAGLFEGYAANLAATLVGLLLGIPFALYLVHVQQAGEARAAARVSARRKRDVLIAIERELSENLADLFVRVADPRLGRQIMVPALSIEVWRAMSESGELQPIEDPELLRVIARAYRFVGQTRAFEDMAWRTMSSNGSTPFRDRLAQTDPITKAAMDEAVAAINAALRALPSTGEVDNGLDASGRHNRPSG